MREKPLILAGGWWRIMCLLKVYVNDSGSGGREIAAENVVLIAVDRGFIRILNVDAEEKILPDMKISLIDALNSIVIIEKQ
ncbi:MAG: CooT family nickel-binding protein [Candidatus Bathyarchaeota archaeon]|nr:CooT family nickel-binding protein [Candidatus Bathyarchaeota archaeon]